MQVSDLAQSEYDESTSYYINLIPEGELIDLWESQSKSTMDFFKSIPLAKHDYAYEKGKWTVKEVFRHIIDTERIFTYRALRFARNDQTILPGFEVEDYIHPAQVEFTKMSDLLLEYQLSKQANIAFTKSLDEEMLRRGGIASGYFMTTRALLFKLVGHEVHHCRIVEERYLK